MKLSIKNGFTLLECLFSLLVCSIVSMIGIIYIETCMNVIDMKQLQQNQFAILQLRQLVSISHDVHIEQNSLKMI